LPVKATDRTPIGAQIGARTAFSLDNYSHKRRGLFSKPGRDGIVKSYNSMTPPQMFHFFLFYLSFGPTDEVLMKLTFRVLDCQLANSWLPVNVAATLKYERLALCKSETIQMK
jgi:hypothetical protein